MRRLVAYIVPVKEQACGASELRKFVKQKLPEYMIPSAFVLLDVLPLTANGKVDRKLLPAAGQNRPELEAIYVAPRTSTEERLAEIWSKLLVLNRVGIRDNFFDLGGHSLLAMRLFAEIEKEEKRKQEQAQRGFDGLTFFVYKTIEEVGVENPEELSKKIKTIFLEFPNWRTSEKDLREVRNKLTIALYSVMDDLDKVTNTVNNLLDTLLKPLYRLLPASNLSAGTKSFERDIAQPSKTSYVSY